jgi:chorismate-pyruvate lyase
VQLNSDFDPLRRISQAQFARPTELSEINFRTLSSFHRALLVIDGTVTRFLEAHTMEPMEVVRLDQSSRRVREEHPWLEAAKDTSVALRRVLIRGRYSHEFHVYAESLIVLERLAEETRRRLEIQGESLGRVINEAGLETRREILWYGRERLESLPPEVAVVSDGEFISRAYRIIAGGSPVALVNERFPYVTDRLPAHH